MTTNKPLAGGPASSPLSGITPESRWTEIRDALAVAQKSNRNAPAYSRWVNRPLGRLFAVFAYKWGLSPNAVSLVSAIFTFSAILGIALGTPSVLLGVLVAFGLMIGYALDSSDGQVARLSGKGSLAGEWLDHVLDAAKNTSFHIAVGAIWLRNLGDWEPWTLVVPAVFALQASVWFFTMVLSDLLLRIAGVKKESSAVGEGKQPVWTSLLGIPVDYGFLCVTMMLLGWFTVWRWLYLLLMIANVLILLLQLPRWYRRVRAV